MLLDVAALIVAAMLIVFSSVLSARPRTPRQSPHRGGLDLLTYAPYMLGVITALNLMTHLMPWYWGVLLVVAGSLLLYLEGAVAVRVVRARRRERVATDEPEGR